MSVTVNQILSLPAFKDAFVLAGADSLDNVALHVSVADSPVTEADYAVSQRGDFFLSGFYFAKDSIKSMYEFFETLVMTNASGICLLDEYIKTLPAEIIKYCDDHHLPVLLVSVNISYASMIKEIMELLIFDGQNTLLAKKIASLVNGTLDDHHKLLTLKEINPHFQNYLSAVYTILANEDDKAILTAHIDFFRRRADAYALEYEGGFLGLISYNNIEQELIQKKIGYYLGSICDICPDAIIGISEYNNKLVHAGSSVNQAIAAYEVGRNRKNKSNAVYYKDLGIRKLLLLLSGSQELEDFYHEVLDPIKEYDEKNDLHLYETMCEFLAQKRDYKATAKKLFVHENTVRYRIGKVKEILERQNTEDDFCESFSIALKCRNIC